MYKQNVCIKYLLQSEREREIVEMRYGIAKYTASLAFRM